MSLHQLAHQLKAKGRGPDTELVHMTKGEVAGLHRLARHVYGQRLPTNPDTGLTEAGWLKSLLPTIVGGAVSYYTGSSAAGAAAGAATGAATNKDNRLMGAVTGGMAGYGGGQLGAALADQGISSLATGEGWTKLLGSAATPAGKDAAGNPIAAQKATGLGGWGGALQAGGLGIGVPLLMGADSGGGKSAPSASSIMQDPNAPASYRLKRMYMGGAKAPGATGESSERQWFRDVYEPTGLVKGGAEGGAVNNLPTSQKAYDYLHRRGKLDKPGGSDLNIDETPTDGVGTPPVVDDSGGPQPQIKQKPPTGETVRHGAGNNPLPDSIRRQIEKDQAAGRYYDPEKLIAAYENTAEGKDKRTVLKDDAWKASLKPIEGLTLGAAPTKWEASNDLEGGGGTPAGEDLGYYKDKYGQRFNVIKGDEGDTNMYLKYWNPGKEGFRNVTGNVGDRVVPTYRFDPKTGTAVPINSNTAYEASDWVDNRTGALILGSVLAAGLGGAALAGAGAGAGGAGVGGTLAESLGAGVIAGSPAEAAALEAGMTAGAGSMGGGAASGIGSTLTGAYNAASPYIKGAQTGLSALNTLQGAGGAKAPKGGGSGPAYVAPADAVGTYGGRNLFAKKPPGGAEGGVIGLQSGGFVFPADVVSAIGAGSSSAGLEMLAKKFGAAPVSGTGHGQSDDVHAMIDGEQPARVARDEAVLDAEQVARIGGGDPKKGAKKLYAMMDRVRKQSMGHTRQMRPVKLKELA